MRRSHAWTAIATAAMSASIAAEQRGGTDDLTALLARIGTRVEQYYTHARTLVCTETVVIQPLARDLTFDGHARRLVCELRVEWEPLSAGGGRGEASVVRQLLTVDGRPPRPKDEPRCMDPRPVSPEPLAMLLPDRSREYAFTWAGTATTGGRPSVRLDYRSLARKPPVIEWHDDCVSVDLPGRSRGRMWVDAATDDVVRLDEQLAGTFDIPVPPEQLRRGARTSMTIERADSSIEYRTVQFSDPDEALLVPASIESLTIVQNAGVPRLRTRQTFSNYRRFTAEGRILK